jgi:hypothetical protein
MIEQIIWVEVFNLKFNERYLGLYLDKLKSRKRWIYIFSLIFTSGGLLGSVQCDAAPLIGIALTFAIQVFSVLQEHVVMSDSDLAKVMDLRMLFVNSFNKFEKLYLRQWYKKLTDDEAINEFYEIRSEFSDIHRLYNELHLPPRKKMALKAAMDAKRYLSDYFNLSEEVVEEASKAKQVRSF